MATDFGPTFQKKFHQKVVNITLLLFHAKIFMGLFFLSVKELLICLVAV